MWLKITYDNSTSEFFKPDSIVVSMHNGRVIPINPSDKFVRTSKIFPLVPENTRLYTFENADLMFFDYENPFAILGRINRIASDELKQRIYFSNGSCSVIFISDKDSLNKEYLSLNLQGLNSSEKWILYDNKIRDFQYHFNGNFNTYEKDNSFFINDYSELPIAIRSILDESVASLSILKNKGAAYDCTDVIIYLVKVINIYIEELKYYNNPDFHPAPSTIYTDESIVKDPLSNQHLQNQNIDRLIQINSSLSYVSTQTYSGSIPILERRSIIRRSCLLGVGTSVRALTRIIRYIEKSFLTIDFYEIITGSAMRSSSSSPLAGLQKKIYEKNAWHKSNIDILPKSDKQDEFSPKMVYFSSRNAFRESEFAITASMNCITSGLSLPWTLMTITHEMLHSHVRTLLTSIFSSSGKKDDFENICKRFRRKYVDGDASDYCLIDSIREVILRYCIGTKSLGSISCLKKYDASGVPDYNVKIEELRDLLGSEYKNINEILVHTLDLHYFYRNDMRIYILTIWNSWAPLPNIHDDISQYILRSLLAIASNIDQSPYKRFQISLELFKTILEENNNILRNNHLVSELKDVLEKDNGNYVKNWYLGAFKNSLILIDLVMEVFYSRKVSTQLWNDENVVISTNDNREEHCSYNVPLNFIEDRISCPIPYLYDRMIKVMSGEINDEDIERQTAIAFLAMN